uniref:SGF29 C-terminal domain-containing protein n=1 Tax=Macrostomum lignano TaxID=282301 RepID=A0A1I8J4Y3_9PLAT
MVLALYPQTTCFYRALVDEPPTSVHEDYQLFFEDPSYPEGIAPSLAVPQRYEIRMRLLLPLMKLCGLYDAVIHSLHCCADRPMGSPASENLTVCYFGHPPFSDTVAGQLRGVFWDLARAGLQQCGEPLDFRYRAFASESHLLSDGVTRGCNVSLPVAKAPLFGLLSEHKFLPVVTTPEEKHRGRAVLRRLSPGPGAAPVIGRSLGSCLGKYLKCEQQCNETMGPIVRSKYSLIPLRTSPTAAGAVWLDPTIRPHQSGLSQLNFVVHAWPLLVIILVSCAYAGVIAWLMERLKNPQEFPRPFLRGFWEGCWWAFITMTTVGYGDRSPKTICGRLFAFLWISFGLVITSMFTAGITTALGQSSQSFDNSKLFQANGFPINIDNLDAQRTQHSNQFLEALNPCRGKLKDRTALPASPTPPFTGPGRHLQMTVMNGSFEETLVYEVGSNPIAVNSLDELFGRQAWQHSGSEPPQDHPASSPPASANASDAAGVSHGNRAARHYGALIEHFMYLHMRQEHPLQVAGVKLQMVLKRPSVRGLLTRLRPSLTGCLINWLVTRQHRVLADLVGLQHQGSDAPYDDPKSPEGIAKSLFFTNQLHLLVLAFVFAVLFAALLCWERFWWAPRNPDYQFIEHNWKYERQKKEAEFTQQLDFKSYYKRRKSSNGSLSPPAAAAAAAAGRDGSFRQQQQLRCLPQQQQQQQQQQQPGVSEISESDSPLIRGAANGGCLRSSPATPSAVGRRSQAANFSPRPAGVEFEDSAGSCKSVGRAGLAAAAAGAGPRDGRRAPDSDHRVCGGLGWGGNAVPLPLSVELLEFALHGLQRLGFGGLPADPRVLQGLGGSQPLGGVQLHQAGDQVAGVARNSVPPGWGVQLGAAGPHGTGKPCAVCSSCTASLSSKQTKAARRLLSYTADCTQPFPCFCPRPSRLLASFCTGVQRSYLEIAVNDVLLVQVFQGLEQLADALGRILLRVVATTDDPAQCK